jgi:hypothetical protein
MLIAAAAAALLGDLAAAAPITLGLQLAERLTLAAAAVKAPTARSALVARALCLFVIPTLSPLQRLLARQQLHALADTVSTSLPAPEL